MLASTSPRHDFTAFNKENEVLQSHRGLIGANGDTTSLGVGAEEGGEVSLDFWRMGYRNIMSAKSSLSDVLWCLSHGMQCEFVLPL